MTDQALIEEWLAKNGGPRKFESNVTCNTKSMLEFLLNNGFETETKASGKISIKSDKDSLLLSEEELVTFVDTLRVEMGLLPFKLKK